MSRVRIKAGKHKGKIADIVQVYGGDFGVLVQLHDPKCIKVYKKRSLEYVVEEGEDEG